MINRVLLIGVVLCLNVTLAATPKLSAVKPVDCQAFLSIYVEDPNLQLNKWKTLPAALGSVRSATLLVQVDLGGRDFINELLPLIKSIDGLQTPQTVTTPQKKSIFFYFVAQGTKDVLLNLYARLANANFVPPQYQFLPGTIAGATSVFPEMVIALDDSYMEDDIRRADEQIAKQLEGKKGFWIYNIRGERMIFFYPRTGLPQDIDTDFLRALQIKNSEMGKAPSSWSQWLLRKGGQFTRKFAVVSGDWVILSSEAYPIIYDIARAANSDLPKIANIELPPPSVMAADKKVPVEREAGRMTLAARKLILGVLKKNCGEVGLSEPWGYSIAFKNLVRTVEKKADKDLFRNAVRRIAFTSYEYTMVMKEICIQKAEDRMAGAWRAYLRARHSRYAELPLTENNIRQAILELEIG